MHRNAKAFTLVEVLLALAVLAIALTALLRATSQSISHTDQIKTTTISHWVEMQAVTAIQLGLIFISPQQEISQVTTMLGQRWYWRAKIMHSPIKSTQKIVIQSSQNANGPFSNTLIAYRYAP